MAESPQQYIALLRAINVGGSSAVKMADLRARFEAFGLTEVSTYIQTGNVLFYSSDAEPARLARRLEQHLAASLGYRGKLFILTREQLIEVAANNPFDPARLDHEQRCHIMFLSAQPDPARREALLGMRGEEYNFAFHDEVLYYSYPRAFDGRRRAIDFEKVLGVTGTSRAWNVVDKLIQLTG